MKIKLLSVYCGPSGTHQVNEVIDRDPAEALALVRGGYAMAVGETEEERAEVAVVKPDETRADPQPKKRGR
jgi:hypothetical protein